MAERWGVIGGGLLGLSMARRLAARGCEVTLFEREPDLGGLARPWDFGELKWDRYYHVILPGDHRLLALLDELHLKPELVWRETRTGFFTDGQLHSMSDLLQFLRFAPLGLLDKLRLGATLLYASRLRDWRPLEQTTAVDWLTRWSGPRTVSRIWRPLLRAKLGENAERVSAAYIWATIKRMYDARRAGMKREQLGYVTGGYARILERLTAALTAGGVILRRDQAVSRVHARDGGGVWVTTTAGDAHAFDQAALTVAAPLAADLCPDLTAEERDRLCRLEYQGIVCAAVLLRRPLPDFYVTNITDPGIPFTAVINLTAVVEASAFGGHTLIYLPKYVPADDPLLGTPDAEIQASFTAALCSMYPTLRPEDVLRFAVARDPHVMAIPTVHYSRRLPPRTTSIPGVHIINSAHLLGGNLNVDELLGLAVREVDRLLTGAPPNRVAAGRRHP